MRWRMRAGWAILVMSAWAGARTARAACNIIPSATKTFRGALGSTDRPFVAPGQFLEVRVQPAVCDAASPGLGTSAAAQNVTLVFSSPSGARHVVVLSSDCSSLGAAVTACGAMPSVSTATCIAGELDVADADGARRLRVRFPDTDALLAPDGDGRGFTGPMTVAVTAAGAELPCALASRSCASATGLSGLLACVDELYTRDGTCRTSADLVDRVFGHLTALPAVNDYAKMMCL